MSDADKENRGLQALRHREVLDTPKFIAGQVVFMMEERAGAKAASGGRSQP